MILIQTMVLIPTIIPDPNVDSDPNNDCWDHPAPRTPTRLPHNLTAVDWRLPRLLSGWLGCRLGAPAPTVWRAVLGASAPAIWRACLSIGGPPRLLSGELACRLGASAPTLWSAWPSSGGPSSLLSGGLGCRFGASAPTVWRACLAIGVCHACCLEGLVVDWGPQQEPLQFGPKTAKLVIGRKAGGALRRGHLRS